MVCPRCIHVVKQILTDLGIQYNEVELGYAVLGAGQALNLQTVNQRLESLDLGLVRDPNEIIVTEINKAIHDYMDNISLLSHKLKLSQYIAQQLARNYHQLSKIYSQYKGETIEQYFIELRTNKVKELIKQGKLNLSQIAVNVGYSGIHYLSGQFKKYTGKSLSKYKKEWEASLSSPAETSSKSPDEIEENEDRDCDCGCKECDCEGNNGSFSDGVTPSSIQDKNGSPMQALQIPLQNFGEYRVHISS